MESNYFYAIFLNKKELLKFEKLHLKKLLIIKIKYKKTYFTKLKMYNQSLIPHPPKTPQKQNIHYYFMIIYLHKQITDFVYSEWLKWKFCIKGNEFDLMSFLFNYIW